MDETKNSNSSCDLDDAKFEAYFTRKCKKMWKNKKAFTRKDSMNPKASSKGEFVPKMERNKSEGTSKPIQCFECQEYGHTIAKCANRKEKSKGKALNVAWDEEFNKEVSKPDSPSSESGKFIFFMALSNTSSVQESKSEDDLDTNDSDEEQTDEDYQKLFQEFIRM